MLEQVKVIHIYICFPCFKQNTNISRTGQPLVATDEPVKCGLPRQKSSFAHARKCFDSSDRLIVLAENLGK